MTVARYLCGKNCELWNNHSVSLCSLTPTGMGRREMLWCEGSYEDIKGKKQLLLELNIAVISIYTLSDLGDLSNLIGSLSRTIQQYSPPSEWIMFELGVFPIFLENDLLKVDKILALTFFKARKDLEGFNTAFFNLL